MEDILEVEEGPRGCGYRKPGGLYLRTDPVAVRGCGKLPLPLSVCPCCGEGFPPSRAPRWIDPGKLFAGVECRKAYEDELDGCSIYREGFGVSCPLDLPDELGRALLVWIGERFYPTPESFLSEISRLGLSRRIASFPKGFEVGKTFLLFAHRRTAVLDLFSDPEAVPAEGPAIFSLLRPTRVEYVVKDGDGPRKLARIRKSGILPIKVRRVDEHGLPI